jgi:hypothetical protein
LIRHNHLNRSAPHFIGAATVSSRLAYRSDSAFLHISFEPPCGSSDGRDNPPKIDALVEGVQADSVIGDWKRKLYRFHEEPLIADKGCTSGEHAPFSVADPRQVAPDLASSSKQFVDFSLLVLNAITKICDFCGSLCQETKPRLLFDSGMWGKRSRKRLAESTIDQAS